MLNLSAVYYTAALCTVLLSTLLSEDHQFQTVLQHCTEFLAVTGCGEEEQNEGAELAISHCYSSISTVELPRSAGQPDSCSLLA